MNDEPVVPSERTTLTRLRTGRLASNPKYQDSREPKTYKIQRPGLLWNDINGQSPLDGDGSKH